MANVYFKSGVDNIKEISLNDGETVLNGLLRNGIEVPYGCKNGVCQSCMMKTVDTDVPPKAQAGLRATQKQQGYFLSCCCLPKESMVVTLQNTFKTESSEVLEVKRLSSRVLRLRLEKKICYYSGQYMTLWKDEHTARTYSLASHPTHDDYVEFHVRIYPNGEFSTWAAESLKVGDKIDIQGPMGSCYYTRENEPDQTLFLAGIGTGFAPIYGIVKTALLQGHRGDIHIVIASKDQEGLYMKEMVSELLVNYPQINVYYSVMDDESTPEQQDVYEYAKSILPDFTGVKVFLCGTNNFVTKLRKQCFLSGANMSDIYCDTFLCFSE